MDRNQVSQKLEKSRQLTTQGDLDSARREIESILLFLTDDPEVYLELGRVCMAQGDRSEAEYAFSRCLALDPESREATEQLAYMGVALPPPTLPDGPFPSARPPQPAREWPRPNDPYGANPSRPVGEPSPDSLPRNASLPRRSLAFGLDAAFFFLATLPAMALFSACLFLFPVSREYMAKNAELAAQWLVDPSKPMPDGLLQFFLLFEMVGHLIKMPLYAYFYYVSGQTPGKRLLGIRIVNDTPGGEYLSFVQSILRYLGSVIGQQAYFLGYAIAFFSRRRKAFHDWAARTWVIDSAPIPWQPGEKGLTLLLVLLAGFGAVIFVLLIVASLLFIS